MLKVFRQKGLKKKLLWVIAVLIILSFGLGYSLSRYPESGKMNATAGKVFGKAISFKEYQSYLIAARDQTVLTYGAEAEKVMPFIDMDNETWTRILLVKEAERRGIKVLDREVISYIRAIPAFQRDGDFDSKLYQSIVTHIFRRDAREFEESIRDQIKITKVIQSSVGRINISDQTIREEYIKRNQRMQTGYILIDPHPFVKDMNVADADLQAYYEANRERFKTSDTINVQYVKLPLDAKRSLEEHQKLNTTATEIFRQASVNGDLAAAAKQHGVELRETGLFSMDAPNLSAGWSLELLAQAFEAKTGAVLSPSVTPDGITIIKILEHKPAVIQPFEKAKEQVKESLLQEKAAELARQKAEEVHAALAKSPTSTKDDILTAVRSLGLNPKETPFFAMGEYIPEIGLSEDFHSAAEKVSQEKPLGNIVMTAKGPVIFWFQALQLIDEKKFEEVKNDFALTLYREESAKAINAVVKEIRARAKMESYIDRIVPKKKRS